MTQPPGGYQVGVDLGTSNTVTVLRWPDGRTRPLLFDGAPTMPSSVFLDDAGALQVGRDAQRLAMLDPTRFEPNPKRRIDDGTVLLGNREVPVVDLLAAVLRLVATKATETCGTLPPATLTYPAAWGAARQATLREAAARAGWPAVRLVPEPVAAAQYYTSVLQHPVPPGGAVGVFDFGGGTLDIAVVRRDRTGFTVLASGGLEDLGGLDFDAALVEQLGTQVAAFAPDVWASLRQPTSPTDRRNRRLFWEDVRAAKEMLSRTSTAPVSVPGVDQAVHLTRAEFEQLAGPLLERAVHATVETVGRCRLSPGQLTGLFLVGGASRIPLVGSLLHHALGIAPTVLEQPEMPVAEGALDPASGSTARLRAGVAPVRPPARPVPVNAAPHRYGAAPVHRPGPPPVAHGGRAPIRPPAHPGPPYRPAGSAVPVPPKKRSPWRTPVALGSVALVLMVVGLFAWGAYDRHAYTFQDLDETMSRSIAGGGAKGHVPLFVDGEHTYAAVPGTKSVLIEYDGKGGEADTTPLGEHPRWATVERYRSSNKDVLFLAAPPDKAGRHGLLVGDLSAGKGIGPGVWGMSLKGGARLFATRLGIWCYGPGKATLAELVPSDETTWEADKYSTSYRIPADSRLLQSAPIAPARNWIVLEAARHVLVYDTGPKEVPNFTVPVHSDKAVAVATDDDKSKQAAAAAVFVADPSSDTDYTVGRVTATNDGTDSAWTDPVVVRDRVPRWIGLCGKHLCVVDSAVKDPKKQRITSYDPADGKEVGHHDVTGLDLAHYWGDATTDDVVLAEGSGKDATTEVFDATKGTVSRTHGGVGYLVDDKAVLVFEPDGKDLRMTGLDLTGDRQTDVGTVPAASAGDCAWDAHRISCVSDGTVRSWLYRRSDA